MIIVMTLSTLAGGVLGAPLVTLSNSRSNRQVEREFDKMLNPRLTLTPRASAKFVG